MISGDVSVQSTFYQGMANIITCFRILVSFALLSLLSMVVYYSRDELTPKGWWLRTALHALLLEAMLLPLAHRWGFWYSGTDIIVYAAFILLAKALWHLVDYGISARTAAQINERIRENRLENKKDMIP